MSDPLAAATEALVFATWALVGIGAVQFLVNLALWQANAAQARTTERQLLAANRPRVRIDWRLTPPDRYSGTDVLRNLVGEMREILGKPVILHWAETRVDDGSLSRNPHAVGESELDGDHVALLVDAPLYQLNVVEVEVRASVSTADLPATNETWRQVIHLNLDRYEDSADNRGYRGYRISVIWQEKHRIANADAQDCDGTRMTDALSRAWRGGL